MGEASAILALTNAAVGLAGSVSQASMARASGRLEAKSYETNRALAEEQAKDAIRLGEEEVARRRLETRRLIGAQRAAAAASGIDPTSGSPLELALDAASLSELDAMTIRNNAYRAAWGYRVQAIDYRTRARMARIGARQEAVQTLLAGGLAAARDVTRGVYSWQSQPPPGGPSPWPAVPSILY